MGSGRGLIGKATDVVGITNHKGQKQDQKRADNMADSSMAATQANIEMQREQLQFLKDQYKDWQDVYGDIQTNLGEYYKNMTTDTEIANINTNLSFSLQALATEYGAADKQIKRQMMQAGLSGSGVEAAANTQTANVYASDRARARAQANIEINNAPDTVAQKQMGFLGLGLGQGQALLGNMTNQAGNAGNAYNALASTAGNLSGNYMQRGIGRENRNFGVMDTLTGRNALDSFQTSFGQTMGQGVGGAALGSMFSDYRLKDNLKLVDQVEGFNIYEWEWNKLAKEQFGYSGKAKGVVAQELLQKHTDKVGQHSSGFLIVDYAKLPKSVQTQVRGY